MADPSRYTQSYDFSDYAESNPDAPLPGTQVDIQLADIEDVTVSLRSAIMDVRRSDGALTNGIVTEDSLESGLLATLTAATEADVVVAAAAAAAASADDAREAETALESVVDALEALGYFFDWGSITEAVGTTTDYGSIV